MNRVREYSGFAVWYAGLGYFVLWPLSSPDPSGRRFGASILCGDDGPGPLEFLCSSAHPLTLPPTLHAVGFLAALVVVAQLVLRAVRRWRQAPGAEALEAAPTAPRSAAPAPAWRNPDRPSVKPRSHFGLRGAPD